MTEAERLVLGSDMSVAVLGGAGEFVLVDLAGEIETASAIARTRGFHYCGVLAVSKDGKASAKCEEDMDAALAFAQQVAPRLKERKQGEEWLKFIDGLYQRPDTRD